MTQAYLFTVPRVGRNHDPTRSLSHTHSHTHTEQTPGQPDKVFFVFSVFKIFINQVKPGGAFRSVSPGLTCSEETKTALVHTFLLIGPSHTHARTNKHTHSHTLTPR